MKDAVGEYLDVGADQAPLPFRMRMGRDGRARPIVMLHGLSGDEHAMWVFESALPTQSLLVAPRAPYPQPGGGFGWVPQLGAWPPLVEEYIETVPVFDALLRHLEAEHRLNRRRMILMGFSQGAAMAFAATMLGLSFPPAAIIVAAAHLPQGDLTPLRGLPTFWAHGRRDEVIPIEVARTDVERLREVGALVQLCEADASHKLGKECLQDLRNWFREQGWDREERTA